MNEKEEILSISEDIENEKNVYENRLVSEEETDEEKNTTESVKVELADLIEGLVQDSVSYKEIANKVHGFMKKRLLEE